MANLTNLLLGVASVDGKVTTEEKQHLKETLNRLNLLQGEVGKLTQLMVSGISKQKSFGSLKNFLTLAEPLTKSQRLLLMGLGYEMSAADGSIDPKELTYLQRIATGLNLEPQHLAVFAASFAHQGTLDPKALEEVRYLLDPARFHELDIIFTEAASTLVECLPALPESRPASAHHTVSHYADLERFQQARNQLDQLYASVNQVIQDCLTENYVTETLVQDFGQVWERLRSQRFRIAVVGEFSQGKSTFLNALLGEKIQPSRATPCSGTLTVLRYGERKRVICHYRDGREAEIPIEQYQEKAAIPREAAHGKESASQSLLENPIEEIIFEHPDLELCKSGVEIVDSPGLNEHDDRTRVTQQLLKGTDAVIFLANASRPLTKWEQDFLTYDLRQQMRAIHAEEGTLTATELQEDAPAENLFVLVNFMDLLDEESDREDVRERFHNFLIGAKSILTGENRIHYTSAKAVLKAVDKSEKNEYTRSFQNFVQALEKFLSTESGNSKLQSAAISLSNIIQGRLLPELQELRAIQTNEIQISAQDTQEILKKIGWAQNQVSQIQSTTKHLEQKTQDEAHQSLQRWFRQTCGKVSSKSMNWHCGNSRDREAITRQFSNLYQTTVSEELELWSRQELLPLLERHLSNLDEDITEAFQSLQRWFQDLDQQIGSNFGKRLRYSNTSVGVDLEGYSNSSASEGGWQEMVFGFATMGAIGATIVGLFTGGMAPILAFGSGLIGQMFWRDPEAIQNEIRDQVVKQGLNQLEQEMVSIQARIDQRIENIFQERNTVVQKRIGDAIAATQNVLEQNNKAKSASQAHKQQVIDWIDQQTKFLRQHSHVIRHFIGKHADSQISIDAVEAVLISPRSVEIKSQSDRLTDAEIETMVEQRQIARQIKNWAEADRIRDELQALGIALIDHAGGITHWHWNEGKTVTPQNLVNSINQIASNTTQSLVNAVSQIPYDLLASDVRAIMAQNLGLDPSTISLSARMNDLGDDFSLMAISMELEKKFNIEIPTSMTYDEFLTVGDYTAYISNHVTSSNSQFCDSSNLLEKTVSEPQAQQLAQSPSDNQVKPVATVTPAEMIQIRGVPVLEDDDPIGRGVAATVEVYTPAGSGSGFIIHSDGLIVTAQHVIEGAQGLSYRNVKVRLFPEQSCEQIVDGIVFRSHRALDIALVWLLIEGSLPTIPIGNPQKLRHAQTVYAIGAPAGMSSTVSKGIVSNPNSRYKKIQCIQTDAAIDYGNSGGPLITKTGEAVGITVWGFGNYDAAKFAIPIDYLTQDIELALQHGREACLNSFYCPACGNIDYTTPTWYCRNCGAQFEADA
ncbi:dynamin family protein [Pantanalinema rosaneae CENA516]